jgi:hypothetical protein
VWDGYLARKWAGSGNADVTELHGATLEHGELSQLRGSAPDEPVAVNRTLTILCERQEVADIVEKLREYWSRRNFLIESPGSLNRCVRLARRVESMLRKLRAKNVFQQYRRMFPIPVSRRMSGLGPVSVVCIWHPCARAPRVHRV